MISADASFKKLVDGNARFVSGDTQVNRIPYADRNGEELATQHPFAIIISCSDSRVPVEAIFDQGIGDLFVIRVAGNVVARSQIGSIEFGVAKLGARLIVVMGHTDCGAVRATLEDLKNPGADLGDNLGFLVDRIRPALSELLDTDTAAEGKALESQAIHANVHAAVAELGSKSPILKTFLDSGELQIMGAEYSLTTGEVQFLGE